MSECTLTASKPAIPTHDLYPILWHTAKSFEAVWGNEAEQQIASLTVPKSSGSYHNEMPCRIASTNPRLFLPSTKRQALTRLKDADADQLLELGTGIVA